MIAVYLRISKKKQESIGSQKSIVDNFISQLGGQQVVVEYYIDDGKTGAGKDGDDAVLSRPELRRLIADIKSGKVKTLVVSSACRLGRKVYDISSIVEKYLRKHNVRLHIVSQPHLDPVFRNSDYIMLLLQTVMAQNEVYSIRSRTKAALDAKRKARVEEAIRSGVPLEPRLNDLYGINQYELSVMAMVQKLKDEGHGYRSITTKLRVAGIKTRTGGDVEHSFTKRILRRINQVKNEKPLP